MNIFSFLLGLIIGSFLNVCIYRIPLKKSIAYPPSACPGCEKKLAWYELIPVLSFVLQRGRCRKCGSYISFRYPAVEILTGLLFLILYLKYDMSLQFLTSIILASLMIVIAFIDIDYKIIPNTLILWGLGFGLLLGLFRPDAGVVFMLKGFMAGFIPMFLIAVISRGQMGFGDVKLAGVMGIFLGWKAVITAVFLAFIGGALYGLFLMIIQKKGRKTAVPFGPFLAGSTVLCFIWFEEIISWYLRLLI